MPQLGAVIVPMNYRLVADDFVWALFWVLQAATLLRLGAAVWPAHASVLSAASLGW